MTSSNSRPRSSLFGWVALCVVTTILSYAFLFEWQQARQQNAENIKKLSRVISNLTKLRQESESRWRALARSVVRGQEGVGAKVEKLHAKMRLEHSGAEDAIEDHTFGTAESAATLIEIDWEKIVDATDLPRLPKGIPIEKILESEDPIVSILENPSLNPSGKKLEFVKRVAGFAEVVKAKALRDILDAEIRVEAAEAQAILKEDGEYIDYAPGEPYNNETGALTYGEFTQDGTVRMVYMYPEEFPGLYEKRSLSREVAEVAVRRVLATLQ